MNNEIETGMTREELYQLIHTAAEAACHKAHLPLEAEALCCLANHIICGGSGWWDTLAKVAAAATAVERAEEDSGRA